MGIMKSQELKQARQHRGWTQEAAASHLGVTQSYLNLLENGKRRLTSKVVRRTVSVYGLSPEVLPLDEDFVPVRTNDDQLVEWLARLEYPGFAYLKTHTPRKNPYEVLLTALGQKSLDGRVGSDEVRAARYVAGRNRPEIQSSEQAGFCR
jgi:transcriptional regulator with XRE-family HTH domain